ncbi:MAG: thiol-disulfide oxidoreductase DCC family protein [Bernardetiaceae bacterium]|nr:thiol-disulfide oxidoreductase DCC family protein [Bernardetiaceae bacterium]
MNDNQIIATQNIVLFDGVCNLCNSSVNFLIDRDKEGKLYFASLQSDFGQTVLKVYDLPTTDFKSFIFIKKGRLYRESSAALEVVRVLGGGWQLLHGLKAVPPIVRDGVYRLISKNRYSWFGKKDECRLPTPELKQRFLG